VLNVYGSNGCGKTTLFNIISGINLHCKKEIIFNKCDVYSDILAYFSKVDYITHNNAVNLDLTVMDNLCLWAALSNTEILIPAALHTLGLQEYAHTVGNNLSMGLKRRVDLAKLLLSQKMIWILDEPFSNLDTQYREVVLQMMVSRSTHGGIVIFSSHDKVSHYGVMNVDLDKFNIFNTILC
jgi:heme exporter protein A